MKIRQLIFARASSGQFFEDFEEVDGTNLAMLLRVSWMLVLARLMWCAKPTSSRGQISLSPANGDTVTVLSSSTGMLFVIPPSQYH